MPNLSELRSSITERRAWSEAACVADNLAAHGLSVEARARVSSEAASLIDEMRRSKSPGLMELFLAEYGLTTEEGVALMCLAEAFLRTPDAPSLDALIRDKIGPGDWGSHRARARSTLVNASTWALMLTGRIFRDTQGTEDGLWTMVREAVQRLGEPVARTAVEHAMRVMGRQFVLGRTIAEALDNGAERMAEGYSYSFDMLGEAARTEADARRYFLSYARAITAIAERGGAAAVHDNPGISIKLSALHPRYEEVQRDSVHERLTPRLLALAEQACAANMGLNIDAEEADRLELSLDVFEAVLRTPDLAGWDGFGLVVQAFSKQAPAVLQWIDQLASETGRHIPVRLVKGAYWDTEIKNAQVLGLGTYPVYTRKAATDLAYLRCARLLLESRDRVYPQLATHNAHTAQAVLEIAGDAEGFEFQRLHGMGEDLHERLRKKAGTRCRIYAPVGVHKDLLAYLVRRLLENGANSSFVNQVLDEEIPVEDIAEDPIAVVEAAEPTHNPRIPLPADLYGDSRRNSKGVNLNDRAEAAVLDDRMAPHHTAQWTAGPVVAGVTAPDGRAVVSPSNPADRVGRTADATPDIVETAIGNAVQASPGWAGTLVDERASILERIAELYETNMAELIAIGCREAGKTRLDGVLEVREAVDFCRYYAAEARARLDGRTPLGPVVCISPWNFPLAIFTGQITAALVAGNPVLAKPAEQTTLMAARAVQLMHEAGVPADVLSLLPGEGAVVGGALTSDVRIKGCCFTGSTETAALIDRALAAHGDPAAPLIAETGGLNAMIVDSTALPEQAVRDIVQSAFQSAGQRCSALRVLFVQEDVSKPILEMLEGAANELVIGDPWRASTDVGPVIDTQAREMIEAHIASFEKQGRLMFRVPVPEGWSGGHFTSPAALRLERFEELEREIFGPVLHVLTYRAAELDDVVARINASGYGLTLGMHSRIDARLDQVCQSAHVGNIYVNRNQIGAVVGVQPFGGEGLSGTGPKAGGPDYLYRFSRPAPVPQPIRIDLSRGVKELPGPTGERNTLYYAPRGLVACLGPDGADIERQVGLARGCENDVVIVPGPAAERLAAEPGVHVASGPLPESADADLRAVLFDGTAEELRQVRQTLAKRDGARVPVLRCDADAQRWLRTERVVSEDTTAAGGNATLLADAETI